MLNITIKSEKIEEFIKDDCKSDIKLFEEYIEDIIKEKKDLKEIDPTILDKNDFDYISKDEFEELKANSKNRDLNEYVYWDDVKDELWN